MRLLTLLTITELILGGAGLGASWLLMNSTSRLQYLTSQISTAVESVYTTEQAERALLVHNRESNLYAITKRAEHSRQRQQAERDLYGHLELMGKFAESPREHELLRRANEGVALYIKERQKLEEQGATPDVLTTSVFPLLDETEEALSTLMQINYDQAQHLQQRAQQEDTAANRIGLLVAAGVLLILTAAFVLLHHGLRQPHLKLKRQIENLQTGRLSEITPSGLAELREIATAFNELVRRVSFQRESQLRFLAGVAHDLRTPLNAIKLSATYLATASLDGEERSTLAAIERQVSQLDRQVGDLLDTTRVESGHLELKVHSEDLRPIVENAVQVFRGWSARHTIRFTAPDHPIICECDSTRIGQVINNLISNALKYSPSGGDVAVELSSDQDWALIKVSDQGIGIAPEDLRHLFEPFRRTATTRETIPGVGLGLSVSKRIAEAHHGSIEVSSVRGAGSTFTLRLPQSSR
jgi:signal transduction histidine kinase